MKNIPVLLVFLILSVPVFGQKFLVLEKMGTKKRFEYHLSEKMDLKLDNDDYFTRITLLDLSDSAIYAENMKINFSTINAIKLNKSSGFFKISGPLLMVAGAALLVFDIVNQTAVQGGEYQSSTGVYVASAALVSVGTIFTFAGRDKVKLKKWWRLRTVEI